MDSLTRNLLYNRLIKTMPATLVEFYSVLWARWPTFHSTLPQHQVPLHAAMAAIQHADASQHLVEHARVSPEDLVSYFEELAKDRRVVRPG